MSQAIRQSDISPATNPDGSKATFVLVHGAHHGGWCWRYVAYALRQLGHAVSTPTQTGLGERQHLSSPKLTLDTFVLDIVNHIEQEELTDIILVGHSFGGLSVSATVDRIPQRIRRVVYLDSLLVANGQSPLDVLTPEAAAARRASVSNSLMPIPPVTAFGIPVDHPLAPWVQAHLSTHPFSVYDSRLTLAHPLGNGVPCTYIASTQPTYAALQNVRDWVRREHADWSWLNLATSHDSMITAPNELARVLAGVAKDSPAKAYRFDF